MHRKRSSGGRSIVLAMAITVTAWGASTAALAGSCTLGKIAEFPITMVDMRPEMTAKINDQDVKFLVDSGAFYSVISPASAAELKLPSYAAPFGFYITGVGGAASVSIAKVQVFTLAGVPLHNIEFLVGGSAISGGTVGVLGQNVLHIADVEYDLGQGVVRLMQPHDCDKTFLAYWVKPEMPYSVIKIDPTTPQHPHTMGSAFINGHEIRVMFDSGAGVSTLSLKAAARVGVKPDSPGVVYAGPTYGFGRNMVRSYIAPFASFKIGDEQILNTRLRIEDEDLADADMLIGPDFFLSHRIYVANRQHKLYFTYNGGPVFNLAGAKYQAATLPSPGSPDPPALPQPPDTTQPPSALQPPSGAEPPGPSAPASAAPAAPAAGSPGTGGTEDAADHARRGAALAARRDFAGAVLALTRACELAPENAEYWYQRGYVYWQLREPAAAMADFNQALKLKPGYVRALVSRAELSLQGGDKGRAGADLDAADAAASTLAEERLEMAQVYARAGLAARAIAQYNFWIPAHSNDARLPEALAGRCWNAAGAETNLTVALEDCNAALQRVGKSGQLYAGSVTGRALVWLRMGKYDKSVEDYDAAIKQRPAMASAWYGRGIAKLRAEKTADGEADIAKATMISPKIADQFKRWGIVP